ncbi:MAG: pilus assembly protein TadG-related protein [Acidimicrobiia bacterium]
MVRKKLLRRLRVVRRNESGATLILIAMLLTVLLGMAAFAVDYGWLYWNGIKIQHGADAAALAGVVYEPGDQATAYSEARAAAQANGYNSGNPGTTVTPVDFADDPTAVENENQLSVTVRHTVPTFFMKVFGYDTISIGKSAVAEYALPLAMGSDLPYFGQDPALGNNPNFWANIHGYYTGRQMGDRFSSQCDSGGSGSGCTKNAERRETLSAGSNNGFADYTGGYVYGIEVPAGATNLSVEIFDGTFYRGGNDNFLVGDNEQGGSPGPTTLFMLYGPDPTPLDTTDGNKLLCVVRYTPEDTFADFDGDGDVGSWDGGAQMWIADPDDDQNGDGWFDWTDVELGLPGGVASLWDQMCGVQNEGPGIYPLRVVVEDPGGSDDRGLNRYSLRSSTAGGTPRFYGLGDMAIYANFAGNQSTFNLAEVGEFHAGKELVIELWDPDSGNNGVRIELPDGSLPMCTWTATDGRSSGGSIPCDISYGTSFNNHHMQIRIDIPNGYTCGAACWWTIDVSYPGGANDTTTWSARVEGNPVRLVE